MFGLYKGGCRVFDFFFYKIRSRIVWLLKKLADSCSIRESRREKAAETLM